MIVSAQHPSGKFTTNTSVWFTNAATGETVFNSYDTGGYLTWRIWKNASGQTNRTQGLVWDHKGRLTGYGAVPGYRPLPLGRGRYVETAGYVWLGARFYNPESGSFLNSDPVWNGRDPNYYTFAGGDPINYFDPDGRMGRNSNPYNSYINGIPSGGGTFSERLAMILAQGTFADTSFGGRAVSFGSGLGMTALGFVPWVNDGIDIYTVGAPDSSPMDRAFSSVSLGANVWTLGAAPNYAPIKTGLSRMVDAFRSAPTPHAPHVPTPPSVPHTPPPSSITPPTTPTPITDPNRLLPAPQRPTWQQSEIDVGQDLSGWRTQQSFKDRAAANYGESGSVRPDFSHPNLPMHVDVKNYDLTSASSRANLYNTVAEQAADRAQNLPAGSFQGIILDIRGQSIDPAVMQRIPNNIQQATSGQIRAQDVIFKRN